MAAKKLPKAPKKPKRSASYATWERYDQRVKEWQHKCAVIIQEKTKKEHLIRKHEGAPKLTAKGHLRRIA